MMLDFSIFHLLSIVSFSKKDRGAVSPRFNCLSLSESKATRPILSCDDTLGFFSG
jgi:hypothetical protein